jgi:putative ABC transport system permease protein
MKYQLLKVWNDVRSGGSRSLLVVFALALGLWGVGSVAVSFRILSPDLRRNFLGTEPPHAIITLESARSLDPRSFGPSVEAAEYRDFALLRIEVKPNEWIPLWLFGVEDFEKARLAKLQAQSGAFVPPPGTMVIERDARLISDLDAGVTAKVRSGSKNLLVPIAGVVFDPAQAPATQDHFVYAYADQATWAGMSGQESGHRLILRFHDVHSEADVRQKIADLKLPASAAVQIPPFEQHPHQWQLNLLLGIIGSVGLLAFLMSSVLVSQVIEALLASQIRQVGILKAIGASRSKVFGLYSIYLLFFAVLSGVLAVPLSALSGQAFAAFVARILNFDVLTRNVPTETWVLLCGAALILPFLFAFPTLARAGRISVREALADARIVASERGPRAGSWALRNLARRPARSLIAIGATALGVAIFVTGFNMRESLYRFLTSSRDAMRYDLQVVLLKPMDTQRFAQVFAGLSGVAASEFWNGGRGALQSKVVGTDSGLGVVALPPGTDLFAPKILQGRFIAASDSPEAALNQTGWETMGRPAIGSTISLTIEGVDRRAVLVGIIEEFEKGKVYLDQKFWDLWANLAHLANTLTIVGGDRSHEGVMELKRRVEKIVATSDLQILFVMSQAERTKIIADHLDIVLFTFTLLAFLVLGVSALGQASASSITVRERTREIGVLRAIGAVPRRITGLFVAEGMWTVGTGLFLGIVLSWPLSQAGSALFGALMIGEDAVLRFAWNLWGLAITAAITLIFGGLASRVPAQAAIRVSTRSALSYE